MNCSFDELLELSQKGDNRTIDMLVGDIYGGMDYNKVNFAVDHIVATCNCKDSSSREYRLKSTWFFHLIDNHLILF